MESCDVCISEACKALEAAGYASESVKVIGEPHVPCFPAACREGAGPA